MSISISGGVSIPGRITMGLAPGDPEEITVNAVRFSNDRLEKLSGLTDAADSKSGVLSFWILPITDDVTGMIMFGDQIDNHSTVLVVRDSDNDIRLDMRSVTRSIKLRLESASPILVAGGWAHILASWDVETPSKAKLYVNDVDDTNIKNMSDGTIDYTVEKWEIGSNNSGDNRLNAYLAEYYFQPGEFLDLTVSSNRRKFISAGGKPVDMGSDGSAPTGNVPIIFLSGPTVSWHTNEGGGGGFNEVGSLSNAPSSPSDS